MTDFDNKKNSKQKDGRLFKGDRFFIQNGIVYMQHILPHGRRLVKRRPDLIYTVV